MHKQEFLDALRSRLKGLPREDVEERLAFWGEMIDDRIEESSTEEEAVSKIGTVDEIASQIIADIPFIKIAKEKIKPQKRLHAWEIVLLALGSPIWLSLAIAAFAVMLSLYAVLWSLIASVWAIFASLVACAFGGAITGALFAIATNAFAGLALISAGLVCAGLSILLFFGGIEATKGTAWLTKRIALGIKKCFVGKEKRHA